MPEGHTIHRLARDHGKRFAGAPVASSSPQGRFADGAAIVDGRVLESVEAYGKHLLYWFAGELAVHVHLGLYGTFTTHLGAPPQPGPSVRWRMSGGGSADLVGPTACEVWDVAHAEALRARLGPDPLRGDADPQALFAALRRRRTPIGAALLDQKLLAGVGNVFRAEALFVCGIHPDRPAASLRTEAVECLWATLSAMLRDGVRRNRIVTVPAAEQDPDEPEGRGRHRFVYHRTGLGCRRCGTPVRAWEQAARTVYACPRCQPAP